MLIACLGWGSLVWDPRELAVQREWFSDGPLLPIEFAGVSSKDGRLTLVLLDKAPVVRSLWTLMTLTDLDEAKNNLAKREEATSKDKVKNIGYWSAEKDSSGVGAATIGYWAKQHQIEGVIWTALPGKFGTKFVDSLPVRAVSHLRALPPEGKQVAETYIRHTPRQIDTAVRRAVEREFGWSPLSSSIESKLSLTQTGKTVEATLSLVSSRAWAGAEL
jgi:hypothetical protein